MNDKDIVLTKEGLEKLELELDELKTKHRKEVNDRIRQAKEFGDISENAEYEDAKQEQAFVEGRIIRIEQMIRNARLIDASGSISEDVQLGASVRVKDLRSGDAFEFSIVGSAESDPPNKRLSNESPLGLALLGKRKGDTIDVETPRGKVQYKIEAVNKTAKKAAGKKAS